MCDTDRNVDERCWKVYVHTNKENGKRYVGITSLDVNNRWRNGKGYTPQVFGRAIEKYGWDGFEHTIIKDNLTSYEANQLECELIAEWNTQDSRYGYNVVCGGGGIRGFKFSDESRAKMSESAKHRKICYTQRKKPPAISESTRKKMSANNAGKNNPNYGRKHTQEALQKMSAVHSKPVAVLDDNNERILEFKSATEASKYFGVSDSTVGRCCKNEHRRCNGYKLIYV